VRLSPHHLCLTTSSISGNNTLPIKSQYNRSNITNITSSFLAVSSRASLGGSLGTLILGGDFGAVGTLWVLNAKIIDGIYMVEALFLARGKNILDGDI